MVLGVVAVSYERGTPVRMDMFAWEGSRAAVLRGLKALTELDVTNIPALGEPTPLFK